jgi:hypothetical protein
MCFHRAIHVSGERPEKGTGTYRFWLLAHTVQNLSLNVSSGTLLLSACASLAPSRPMGGSAGGGGGGGGTGDACCCRALSRGSMMKARGRVWVDKESFANYTSRLQPCRIFTSSQQTFAKAL